MRDAPQILESKTRRPPFTRALGRKLLMLWGFVCKSCWIEFAVEVMLNSCASIRCANEVMPRGSATPTGTGTDKRGLTQIRELYRNDDERLYRKREACAMSDGREAWRPSMRMAPSTQT